MVTNMASNEDNLNRDQFDKDNILRKRAEVLAQKRTISTIDDAISIVEFQLGYETYAVEIEFLREVCFLRNFTTLPGTPSFIIGIINLHGIIISVIDIRRLLGLTQVGLSNLNIILVMSYNDMEIGVLVDKVIGMRSIDAQEFQSALPVGIGLNKDYLKGVNKDRLILLNMARILSDEKLIINDEVD